MPKNIQVACHHLHIDKSCDTVTSELLHESQVHMKEKWILMRDIKQNYAKEESQKANDGNNHKHCESRLHKNAFIH